MAYQMRGGVSLSVADGQRLSRGIGIVRPTPPSSLHIALPDGDLPAVRVGDRVYRGQRLTVPTPEAAAIHAPEAGFVSRADTEITIELDGTDETAPSVVKVYKRLAECEPDEIIEKIRDAGIVCADGSLAADAISRAAGRVDVCIVDCVSDTAAGGLLSSVLNGTKIILRALGVRRGVAVAADDVGEIVRKLSSLCRKTKLIDAAIVKAKYPQGSQRRLVRAVTGREAVGDDPLSAGAFVVDAQTCAAIFDAFVTGMPQTKVVVTVCGRAANSPCHIETPIGVRISELIALAGGASDAPYDVIIGDVMTGVRVDPEAAYVEKTTRMVTLLPHDDRDTYGQPPVCIKCGRCAAVCPERLMPHYIYNCIIDGKAGAALRWGAERCVGCGLCTYICPGRAPVFSTIRSFVDGVRAADMKIEKDGGERGDDDGED